MDITGRGTVWSYKKLLIQWPIEIMDLFYPKKNDFPVRYVNVYQRVSWRYNGYIIGYHRLIVG